MGKKKNAKNTSRTHELIQTLNTGGHEVVRATIPSKIHGSYTNRWISGPPSHKHLREGETLKDKMKNREDRRGEEARGLPSSI
jgi:hypothetical protein